MPAITVDDITTLQRLPQVAATATPRRVRSVTTAPSGFEGEGFPVRRAFAGVDLADLDPFIHMDQMGEVEYAPGEPKGTSWHPHRGFETVTYIIDGIFEHEDSNGGGGVITDGDTQWMTAGCGMLHIEKPPEHLVLSGGLFHGIQLWVNLPPAQKWPRRATRTSAGDEVALLTSTTAARWCASSPARSAGHRVRAHLHPDHRRARHRRPGATLDAAVGPRLQRARVRAGRPRHRRAERQPVAHGPARRPRPRRRGHRARPRRAQDEPHTGARGAAARRPAHPRARRVATARS